nr:transposase [Streptomyces triticiradicis]
MVPFIARPCIESGFRTVIDGIRFRVRTGVPWRDVPVEYGPWGRVYDLFRRWQ